MCGIAGIVSPHSALVQQTQLQQMADALQHRGPDGEGFWLNDAQTLGLAHRRLAIIDVSPHNAQPFHYLHYSLIFNGEIYNYRELKDELKTKGYTFTTTGDTEVIPAAYDCWGDDFLNHFDGMFAFALWNDKTQQLLLARDRFGEKPLYYFADYQQRGKFERFLFASEMKALFIAGAPTHLNGGMMLNYITLGYVQNPQKKTETFYANILSLPPGHHLTVQPKQGRVQMKKWYRPNVQNIDNNISEKEAVDTFRELLITSINRRQRADVSIGTSLSGGIDSSAIVACMQQLLKGSLAPAVFTATFPGFEKDEAANSKLVADHFNLRQYTVTPTADDWITHWQQLMYHQEEPLQSSSVLTQFMVYKLAKENNVTVLLDGQGADETLGGYKKYANWYLQQLLRESFTHFSKEKKLLSRHQLMEPWSWRNYAAAFYPEKAAEQLQKRSLRLQNSNALINKDFLHKYQNKTSLHKPVIQTLEDILYYNSFNFGLEELLRYADRNSMAHSTEVRLPFLNHHLVEFIFSLPASFKIKNGFTKWILRQSMQPYLPHAITWQTGKTGYEPPQKQWMQQPKVIDLIQESRKKLIQQNILSPLVNKTPVNPLPAHVAGNYDWRFLCAASMLGG